MASFATEKIVGADKGFLAQLWDAGRDHSIAGAATAGLAAYFFYLQRSHLAWYYGQIALAESLGSKSADPVENWLVRADRWDTWVRYHAAFAALTVSFAAYAYAVAETLTPWLGTIPKSWTLWLPLFLAALFTGWRWHILEPQLGSGLVIKQLVNSWLAIGFIEKPWDLPRAIDGSWKRNV